MGVRRPARDEALADGSQKATRLACNRSGMTCSGQRMGRGGVVPGDGGADPGTPPPPPPPRSSLLVSAERDSCSDTHLAAALSASTFVTTCDNRWRRPEALVIYLSVYRCGDETRLVILLFLIQI